MFSAMNVSDSEPFLLFENTFSKASLYIVHFSALVKRRCDCCADAIETVETTARAHSPIVTELTPLIIAMGLREKVMAERNTCISHLDYLT